MCTIRSDCLHSINSVILDPLPKEVRITLLERTRETRVGDSPYSCLRCPHYPNFQDPRRATRHFSLATTSFTKDNGLSHSRPTSPPDSLPISLPSNKAIALKSQAIQSPALLNLHSITSIQTRSISNANNPISHRNNTLSPRNQRTNQHPPRRTQHPRTTPPNRRNPRQNQTPRRPRPRIPHLLQNGPEERLPELPRLATPPERPRFTSFHPRLPASKGLFAA